MMQKQKTITVFTPTFNRAYCLQQVYESLCRQTINDFIWLIIDDGSIDNTKEHVQSWIEENKIDIQYHYKVNGGMHTGHNAAYKLIQTPLNVCIDSDDYLTDNAIELILQNTYNLSDNFAGIVGLDADKNGTIIGTKMPEKLHKTKLNELYLVHKVKGDKKLVYRTEVVKKYPPYPEYPEERFVPLDYIPLLIDQEYFLKPINEVLCIVEYQPDGSSMNIIKQYRKNPKGFAFSRINRIQYGLTFKERFKNAIHLVSCVLFSKEYSSLWKPNNYIMVLLVFPFGTLLNLYIRFKTRK
jgi:glycosyltransferase involved in cell wall biosynthesis